MTVRNILGLVPVSQPLRIVDDEMRDVFDNTRDVVGGTTDYDIMQHIDHSLLDREVKHIYSDECCTTCFMLKESVDRIPITEDHFLMNSSEYMFNWMNLDGTVSTSEGMKRRLFNLINELEKDDMEIVKMLGYFSYCDKSKLE